MKAIQLPFLLLLVGIALSVGATRLYGDGGLMSRFVSPSTKPPDAGTVMEWRQDPGNPFFVYAADAVYAAPDTLRPEQEHAAEGQVMEWMRPVLESRRSHPWDEQDLYYMTGPVATRLGLRAVFIRAVPIPLADPLILRTGNGGAPEHIKTVPYDLLVFRGSLNIAKAFSDDAAAGNWRENILQGLASLIGGDVSANYYLQGVPDDLVAEHLPLYDAARNVSFHLTAKYSTYKIITVGHSLGGGLATFALGNATMANRRAECRVFNPARLSLPLNEAVRQVIGSEFRVRNFRVQGDIVSDLSLGAVKTVGYDVTLNYVPAGGVADFWQDKTAGYVLTRHPMAAVWRSFAMDSTQLPAQQMELPKQDKLSWFSRLFAMFLEKVVWVVTALAFALVGALVLKASLGIPVFVTLVGVPIILLVAVFSPQLGQALAVLALMVVIALRLLRGFRPD